MARKFEKISFEQFKKDIKDDQELYNTYNIPVRKTKTSAGYDFEALEDYIIKPNKFLTIPTGIKAEFNDDEVLFIIIRGSMGFKYNIRMSNQVGVIDSDYYNNEANEGHMFIKLQNKGSKDYYIKKGQGIAQGIFMKYLITDDEEEISAERKGGFGSTNKGED